MVVVSIIGILTTIAYPRFRVFQAKARQAEARVNLSHIYTLQQSYWADNDQYLAFTTRVGSPDADGTCDNANDLGFVIENCARVRYAYSAPVADIDTFQAVGISGGGAKNRVLPGCNGIDTWQINEDRVLCASHDVTKTSQCAAGGGSYVDPPPAQCLRAR